MDNLNIKGALPLILIAEDDDSNFRLLNAIIGKKCEILWAKNGLEALRLYKENSDKIRLILMDLKMPGMDGFEATSAIRETDKNIPIIVQTAYAFSTDREKAIEMGCNKVLIKPISIVELRKTISTYINNINW
ncbi:MAG: response regulator [Bacteroidales bacterium]|nr:response regulator [Bacteroidales bacterium]